jgi:hypothetical protein
MKCLPFVPISLFAILYCVEAARLPQKELKEYQVDLDYEVHQGFETVDTSHADRRTTLLTGHIGRREVREIQQRTVRFATSRRSSVGIPVACPRLQ